MNMFECLGKAVLATTLSRLPLFFILETMGKSFPKSEGPETKESK